jgi:hypothetical protein
MYHKVEYQRLCGENLAGLNGRFLKTFPVKPIHSPPGSTNNGARLRLSLSSFKFPESTVRGAVARADKLSYFLPFGCIYRGVYPGLISWRHRRLNGVVLVTEVIQAQTQADACQLSLRRTTSLRAIAIVWHGLLQAITEYLIASVSSIYLSTVFFTQSDSESFLRWHSCGCVVVNQRLTVL